MNRTEQNFYLASTRVSTKTANFTNFVTAYENVPEQRTIVTTTDGDKHNCSYREQYETPQTSIQKNINNSTRSGRERHKNLHTYCVALSAQQYRPHAMDSNNITSTQNEYNLPLLLSSSSSSLLVSAPHSFSQLDLTNDDRRLNKNLYIADSISLSDTQLGMPIDENRLGVSVPATSEVTWAAAVLHRASQSATFECRCFKKNGDISMSEQHFKDKYEIYEQNKRHKLQRLWQQLLLRAQFLKTIAASKVLLFLVFLVLATSANCWAGRQDVLSNCTFPARWEGSWFLSGYQQSIHIKGSQFSYRGKCAASDGNKYLIVDEKGCHRCLVIYEKHKNVLQYKESECEGDSMYMHQSNPSAMAMRSVLKQSDLRGGAHPNTNGHSRLSSSDQYIMRSNDDMNDSVS